MNETSHRIKTPSSTHQHVELKCNRTYLSMSSHLNTSVQKLVKVLAELPRGHGQLAAGASGGVDHVAGWLVQVCRCLVQITLGLLERLGGGRDLKWGAQTERQALCCAPLVITLLSWGSVSNRPNSQFQSAASCWPPRCSWEPCPHPSGQADSWRSYSGNETQPWPPGKQSSLWARQSCSIIEVSLFVLFLLL